MSSKTNKTKKWNYGDYTYWYLDGSGEIIGQSIGGNYAFVQNLSFGMKDRYDFVMMPSNAKKLPKWKGDSNKEQGWYEVFQEQMESYKLKETA